jgi:hypothetical protein
LSRVVVLLSTANVTGHDITLEELAKKELSLMLKWQVGKAIHTIAKSGRVWFSVCTDQTSESACFGLCLYAEAMSLKES